MPSYLSYNAQIITFTFPHIGNVGTNLDDYELSKSFASGIITREPPPLSSNWRSEIEFENWLIKMKLTGIYGIDTRLLTKYIKDKLYTCAARKNTYRGFCGICICIFYTFY